MNADDAKAADVPPGFTPLERRGGAFLTALGPLYVKREESGLVLALRIEPKHLNTRGVAHGGMLMTLADSALGIALAMSQPIPRPMVTVNLGADFLEAAHDGDWVEARVDIQKVGRRLAFASCQLWVGQKRILRASGVFSRVPAAGGEGPFEG